MSRKIFLASFILLFPLFGFSQELKCNVQVLSSKIQGTNKQVFRTMQTAITEFVNTNRWTKHVYSYDERIECSFLFNLTDQISADEFKGSLQIKVSRPVFNTSYKTTIFNFKDDVQFKYVEYQQLEFSDNLAPTSLTGLLAYYAYLILGLDYDSFSPNGGTPYFSKAEEIVNKMQNSTAIGWKSFESRTNRYWLIENFLNQTYQPVRSCLYKYHRLGLDRMADHLTEARTEIAESLRLVHKAYRSRSGSLIFRIFFDAKADELVHIFSESFADEKKRVFNILSEVDPSNIKKYDKIIGQ